MNIIIFNVCINSIMLQKFYIYLLNITSQSIKIMFNESSWDWFWFCWLKNQSEQLFLYTDQTFELIAAIIFDGSDGSFKETRTGEPILLYLFVA